MQTLHAAQGGTIMDAWPNPLQQVAEAGFVVAKAAGPRALMLPCVAGNALGGKLNKTWVLLDFKSQLQIKTRGSVGSNKIQDMKNSTLESSEVGRPSRRR